MHASRWGLWLASLAISLLGCDAATPSSSPRDAAPPAGDAGRPDAGADQRPPDAEPADAGPADAAARDAAPDAAPDAALTLDATPPDAAEPDAGAVDTAIPDADVPDAAVPDACVPACAPLACGGDGCGGQCGPCPAEAAACDAGRCVAPPPVVLAELFATGDGDDWIELFNRSPQPVDLAGWALSDAPADLTRWRFPEGVVLAPGGRLQVFASGDDRRDPDAPLHTDFRLAAGGELLALVYRDGVTVVDVLAPYPAQHPDISYGRAEAVTRTVLLTDGSPATWRLPAPGDGWLDGAADDAAWAAATLGIGFAGAPAVPDPADRTNVALGQPARQSSQLGGFDAGRAVNGDFGDFTHTQRDDLTAEWAVTLPEAAFVAQVDLHNRAGCCGSRLRDITVSLHDADGAPVWTSALLNPEDALGAPAVLSVTPEVFAHEVRVQRLPDPDLSGTGGAGNDDEATVLSLGEVEVWAGVGGVGPRVQSDVGAAVRGVARGIQVRVPFTVDDPSALTQLTLQVAHDAGFVAWINGAPVAQVRSPALPLAVDAQATAEAPQPIAQVELDVSATLPHLRPGANLLALHALTADDDDLLIAPTLTATAVASDAWAFFDAPTPGAPNEGTPYAGVLAPVTLSAPHGWYDAPLALEIAHPNLGAEVRYTLDGTVPDADTGAVPDGPLVLTDSAVVRATALRAGWRPAPVTTATYLFAEGVRAQDRAAVLARGFPERWGNVEADYAVDPRVAGPGDAFGGRYADTLADDLRAIPTLAITSPIDGLFGPDGSYTQSQRSGLAWERAAALELIEPDGPGFQIDCGLRLQGGAFRSHGLTLKHSLRLLFKGVYGPSKLEWPLLGDGATDRFDTVTLRANSNDGWQWGAAGSQPTFIRDGFGRETLRAMGGLASHSRFFHVFIDAVYWGVYEAVERPDAAFSATYLGGDKADWDGQNSGSAIDGDLLAWQALLARLGEGVDRLADWFALQGLDDAGAPDPLRPAWVDMLTLADYMLTNLYVGNTDWPRKNFYVGRPRDGRLGFQFYMWDSEWSLGLRSNLDTDRTGVSVGVAQPWDALRANPEFRLLVADRARQHLTTPGGALWVDPDAPAWDPAQPERNRPAARFAALADRVRAPLAVESARWGDQHRADAPYTVDADWQAEVDGLLADYFPARSARFLDQLRRADLYPAVEPAAPNHWGGRVAVGFELVLTGAPDAEVLYTVDGGDPRLPGGEVSPAAVTAAGEARQVFAARDLAVEVQARVRTAEGTWSALTVLRFDGL